LRDRKQLSIPSPSPPVRHSKISTNTTIRHSPQIRVCFNSTPNPFESPEFVGPVSESRTVSSVSDQIRPIPFRNDRPANVVAETVSTITNQKTFSQYSSQCSTKPSVPSSMNRTHFYAFIPLIKNHPVIQLKRQ
jgi:hypothetical protein